MVTSGMRMGDLGYFTPKLFFFTFNSTGEDSVFSLYFFTIEKDWDNNPEKFSSACREEMPSPIRETVKNSVFISM